MNEYANIIYWRKVSAIGGVETFIYELAKKYDYDLALYYNSADENQLKRLIKLIPCVPYIKQKIKCKTKYTREIRKKRMYEDYNQDS